MADHPPFAGVFKLTMDGMEVGSFTEVSGLEVEIQVEEIPEGGQNEYIHRVPGRMKWPNLVLKRGVTTNDGLQNWLRTSSGEKFAGEGNVVPRLTVALSMVDGMGTVLREWTFYDAFPVKWRGPRFSASSNDVATEELEIVHHGFRVLV
ncbi:MAG: phage tail protein [Dehalococcoidia bacterium]|nr:phage tail protein [Dehalococcoidia bacterium]